MKDREQKSITDEEGQRIRLVVHFGQPQRIHQIFSLHKRAKLINCKPPSKEEIPKAITLPKNGKEAGLDNIPPETLKAGGETALSSIGFGKQSRYHQTRKKATF